jgi:hypothetical protein
MLQLKSYLKCTKKILESVVLCGKNEILSDFLNKLKKIWVFQQREKKKLEHFLSHRQSENFLIFFAHFK